MLNMYALICYNRYLERRLLMEEAFLTGLIISSLASMYYMNRMHYNSCMMDRPIVRERTIN